MFTDSMTFSKNYENSSKILEIQTLYACKWVVILIVDTIFSRMQFETYEVNTTLADDDLSTIFIFSSLTLFLGRSTRVIRFARGIVSSESRSIVSLKRNTSAIIGILSDVRTMFKMQSISGVYSFVSRFFFFKDSWENKSFAFVRFWNVITIVRTITETQTRTKIILI